MPAYYQECARISIAGDVLGSSKRHGSTSISSSVIMAYWPGSGNSINTIDYGQRMRVGVIQHYFQHSVTLSLQLQARVMKHTIIYFVMFIGKSFIHMLTGVVYLLQLVVIYLRHQLHVASCLCSGLCLCHYSDEFCITH